MNYLFVTFISLVNERFWLSRGNLARFPTGWGTPNPEDLTQMGNQIGVVRSYILTIFRCVLQFSSSSDRAAQQLEEMTLI